jgi:hypothetical protein
MPADRTAMLVEVFTSTLAFAKSVAVKLVASYLQKQAATQGQAIQRLLPPRWSLLYKRHLAQQLKAMPFIYREDLSAEIMTDFVEVDILDLDTKSFDTIAQTYGRVSDTGERLQRNRRVLILGQAGMGKTTYQRYAIMQLLTRRREAPFVYKDEPVLPIYIPLKLIDTTQPQPVLRYLLSRHSLFNYSRGKRRLLRLASTRRLFLFLDGYDEATFTDETSNYLRGELEVLFGASLSAQAGENAIYAALQTCRMWLTSRREFFDQNRLTFPAAHEALANTVAAVELRGIGSHRHVLVRNIFEKYRRSSGLLRDLLNEEYFISDIDRSLDSDVRKLSSNPLFLTVMCYVYVSRVKEERRHDIDWADSLPNLLMRCIRLLLKDLDEEKARDLPRAFRDGVLRRRTSFLPEKEAFLKYVAAQLFAEGAGVVSLTRLREHAVTFFQAAPEVLHADNVIRILAQLNGTMVGADIVLQLVYSGVFVVVDRIKGESYYDFPHRRFREVLAVEYWSEPERYLELMVNAHRPEYAQVIEFLKQMSGFRLLRFQQDVLRRLLADARHSRGDARYTNMVRNFLSLLPDGAAVTGVVDQFLHDVRAEEAPMFKLPRQLLSHATNSDAEARAWVQSTSAAARSGMLEKFNAGIEVLHSLWPAILTEMLRNLFPSGRLPGRVGAKSWQIMLAAEPWTFIAWWRQLREEGPVPNEICEVIANSLARDRVTEDFVATLLQGARHDEILRVLSFVYRHIDARVGALAERVGWYGRPEWLSIRLNDDLAVEDLKRAAKRGGRVLFVTGDTVQMARKSAELLSRFSLERTDAVTSAAGEPSSVDLVFRDFLETIEAAVGRVSLERNALLGRTRSAIRDAFREGGVDYAVSPDGTARFTVAEIIDSFVAPILDHADADARDLMEVYVSAEGVVYKPSDTNDLFVNS